MGDVFSQVVGEGGVNFIQQSSSNTLLTREIYDLTYEDFLSLIGELNLLSKKCLDSRGYQLVFAVRKDTDSTLFWKATVQIACIKLNPQTKQIVTYRLLNLSEFLKIFKTFKCQVVAAEQSRSNNEASASNGTMSFSTLLNEAKGSESSECIICFERKQDVTLPCAHSYCTQCIEEWNESHDTCPICREKLESPNDTWVISEVPKAEEISKEIRETLLELTEDKPSGCNPS